jgi:HPr kinase/phosphorylase
MAALSPIPSVHGVLLRINGFGVLLTGAAGIGKSTLALSLIEDGHALIADDVVDLSIDNSQVIGHCPASIRGLIHSRDRGFIKLDPKTIVNSQSIELQIELTADAKVSSALAKHVLLGAVPKRVMPRAGLATMKTAILKQLDLLKHDAETGFWYKDMAS